MSEKMEAELKAKKRQILEERDLRQALEAIMVDTQRFKIIIYFKIELYIKIKKKHIKTTQTYSVLVQTIKTIRRLYRKSSISRKS